MILKKKYHTRPDIIADMLESSKEPISKSRLMLR